MFVGSIFTRVAFSALSSPSSRSANWKSLNFQINELCNPWYKEPSLYIIEGPDIIPFVPHL